MNKQKATIKLILGALVIFVMALLLLGPAQADDNNTQSKTFNNGDVISLTASPQSDTQSSNKKALFKAEEAPVFTFNLTKKSEITGALTRFFDKVRSIVSNTETATNTFGAVIQNAQENIIETRTLPADLDNNQAIKLNQELLEPGQYSVKVFPLNQNETLQNENAANADGKFNYGLQFDGTGDYVDVGDLN